MERSTARARLSAMVGATQEPTLADGQLDELLNIFAMPDADGLVYGATGWVGTWNLNAAAAEGYRWRAAACAGDEAFSADGASYGEGPAEKLLKMAETYQHRADVGALGGIGYIEIESAHRPGVRLPVVNL